MPEFFFTVKYRVTKSACGSLRPETHSGTGLSRVEKRRCFLLFLDIREGAEHRFQICVAPDAAVDIVLCDFHHYAGEGDHTDQVRDHHETVEGVRQIPGEVIAHDGAAEDQQHEENPVGDGALFTEEILAGLGAVMAPAQHG